MKESIGILDFEFDADDVIEIKVANIRTVQSLEYALTVAAEDCEKINHHFSFFKEDSVGRCGYDYVISVLKNGERQKELLICFSCSRLIHGSNPYFINRSLFEDILSQCGFEKFDCKTYRFQNPIEGRQFWKGELATGRVDIEKVTQPSWLKYDGSFFANLMERNDQPTEDFLRSVFENDDFEVTSFGFTYMIETTYANYEKHLGEKGDWSSHKKVQLKIIYK